MLDQSGESGLDLHHVEGADLDLQTVFKLKIEEIAKIKSFQAAWQTSHRRAGTTVQAGSGHGRQAGTAAEDQRCLTLVAEQSTIHPLRSQRAGGGEQGRRACYAHRLLQVRPGLWEEGPQLYISALLPPLHGSVVR